MAKKILAIVEGEKKEPELLEKLLSIYGLHNRKIVPYKANIYDLYDKLFAMYGDELENIDIQEFLKELSQDESLIKILNERYTDILLIFDFDPQDNRYDEKKLAHMLQFFSDSTQMGRLYINYPMVESFYHFRSLEDESFLTERFSLSDVIHGAVYKKRVDDVSCIHGLRALNKEKTAKMIRLILAKIVAICDGELAANICEELQAVAHYQMELLKRREPMWVLNTCVLYVYEYNPRMLEWLERR